MCEMEESLNEKRWLLMILILIQVGKSTHSLKCDTVVLVEMRKQTYTLMDLLMQLDHINAA